MQRGATQPEAVEESEFDTKWSVEEGAVHLWRPTARDRVISAAAVITGGLLLAALLIFVSLRRAPVPVPATPGQAAVAPTVSRLPLRIAAIVVAAAGVAAGVHLLRPASAVTIDAYMVSGSCPGRRRSRYTRWWREDIFSCEVRPHPAPAPSETPQYQLCLIHARGGRWILASGPDRERLEDLCGNIRDLLGLKRPK